MAFEDLAIMSPIERPANPRATIASSTRDASGLGADRRWVPWGVLWMSGGRAQLALDDQLHWRCRGCEVRGLPICF